MRRSRRKHRLLWCYLWGARKNFDGIFPFSTKTRNEMVMRCGSGWPGDRASKREAEEMETKTVSTLIQLSHSRIRWKRNEVQVLAQTWSAADTHWFSFNFAELLQCLFKLTKRQQTCFSINCLVLKLLYMSMRTAHSKRRHTTSIRNRRQRSKWKWNKPHIIMAKDTQTRIHVNIYFHRHMSTGALCGFFVFFSFANA